VFVPLPGEDFYGHDYASRMSTYYFFQPHYPRLIRAVGAELGFDARMGTFRDKTSPTIAASESRPCTGFAQRFGDGGRLLYDSVERPEGWVLCGTLVSYLGDGLFVLVDLAISSDQHMGQPRRRWQTGSSYVTDRPKILAKGTQPICGQEIRNCGYDHEVGETDACFGER
jgi:hypothetical protein